MLNIPGHQGNATQNHIKIPPHPRVALSTLKATEANMKREPGTREKVRSKRINLEDNTHAQEINVSECPV
jgi:hypothetical protein